jgi:hypothetical protein
MVEQFQNWVSLRRVAFTARSVIIFVSAACLGCNAQTIDHDAEGADGLQSFYPGGDRALEVRIPPVNNGFGSTIGQLNVSFRIDELERFLKIKHLKMSPALRKQIERDNCRGEDDGSHFSLRIRGGVAIDPFPIKRSDNNSIETYPGQRYWQGNYMGLIAFVSRYENGSLSTTTELIRPDKDAPGVRITCGYLYQPQEGGCIVDRDIYPRIFVNYHFCEKMLPHVKELDAIYMRIARSVIVRPKSFNPIPLTW